MMNNKTISVLGSGWLGLPLATHLQSRGHALRVSTTRVSRFAELSEHGLKTHVVDIHELNDSISLFLQSDVLVCNITSKDIGSYRKLVECIAQSTVSKVLFVSSTSVYANANKMVSEQEAVESPDSPLLKIERLFRDSEAFETTVVRFGGLVGYSRNPANFFRPGRAVRDPNAYVNLIHRDDCINIIERIIERDIWGEVLNACADTHPSKRAFYSAVARQTGMPIPEFDDSGTNNYKIVDNRKLKTLLEYEFIHADLMKVDFRQPSDPDRAG